jgi:hypothetical protein
MAVRYRRRMAPPFFQSVVDYPFVARTQSGALIAGNTRDLLQRFFYFFGVWEPNLTRFLEQRLKSGDVFVDVVLDKVVGPDMIALLRPQPNARSVGQPEPAALGLLMGNLQPLIRSTRLSLIVPALPGAFL